MNAAPKGNAEALRQEGPVPDETPKRSGIRLTTEGATLPGKEEGNLSGYSTGAQS